MNHSKDRSLSPASLVVRLSWMMFLPVLVLACASMTFNKPPMLVNVWDAAQFVLWIATAAAILVIQLLAHVGTILLKFV